jgi:hypothetical protein
MYLPTSQNVSGFADGCPDIEMVFGGESNSLATWSSSTLVFITIQHIKYVSVNINKINFINVYLFVYECTYQHRGKYLDLKRRVLESR